PGAAALLTGFHLADQLPERARHAVITPGQHADIIDQLVGLVILGSDATGTRLEAHVDVLADQHHRQLGAPAADVHQLIDDPVVIEMLRQPTGYLVLAHQDRKAATGATFATLDGYALLDLLRRGFAEHLVDQADRLSAFGCDGV